MMIDLTVTTAPMDHQVRAFNKLTPSRVGALLMDMGTGKTLVALMLASRRWSKISKVVWCCPVSPKRDIARMIVEHTTATEDDVFVFDDKVDDSTLPDCSFYVVGLESVGSSNRVVMALNALIDERTMLVVDESSFIKGHRAKRTRRLTLLGERARYRLILNGTPISQGIEDLFTQYTFLSRKILGYNSWYSFRRAHFRYSEKYKGRIDARVDTDLISDRIAPYTYQVTKDECLDLPKQTFGNHYVSLTPEQERLYEQSKEIFFNEVEGMDFDETGIAIYQLFGRLRAIASGVIPKGLEGHGGTVPNYKMDELDILLEQSEHHSHRIIWCEYRASVEAICKRLGGSARPYFGDMSESKRDHSLNKWRAEGGVLVATTACGGFSLTLNEATFGIFFSSNFKYMSDKQARDRNLRIGQTQHTHWVRIWSDCNLEERIARALQTKGDALATFRREMLAANEDGLDRIKERLESA